MKDAVELKLNSVFNVGRGTVNVPLNCMYFKKYDYQKCIVKFEHGSNLCEMCQNHSFYFGIHGIDW